MSTKAFLVPVVIDATSERGAHVPEKFRELQWTRLPNGETSAAYVERVRRLLVPQASAATAATFVSAGLTNAPSRARSALSWTSNVGLWGAVTVIVLALGYFVIDELNSRHSNATPTASTLPKESVASPGAVPPTFNPPPHSIAVLPFVNMSGEASQDYFSDGLTEELLNSLSRIDDLQVAARTSAFSFKGKDTDIGTIARKLNVAAVLEGSVRRSTRRVRVTAQLINAVTGFHVWSQTYDRNLGDVLTLQSDIANAVAQGLKVTLLKDVTAQVEQGGTRNPAALDAYLRGIKSFYAADKPGEYQLAVSFFANALRADPNYALAFAARSIARANYATALIEFSDANGFEGALGSRDAALRSAVADAQKSIDLAPELGLGFAALGLAAMTGLDFGSADQAAKRALSLGSGQARVLRLFEGVATPLGQIDAATAAAQKATLLDPLNVESHYALSSALYYGRHYDAALNALQRADKDPEWLDGINRGLISYALRDFRTARVSCERNPEDVLNLVCLAVTHDKIDRHADATAMLARIQAAHGDAAAYRYADIYAQWGNAANALQWLEKALRLRDPDLEYLKMDPLLDPLRGEPRFQAIERALKFPD
jgi:TolB-like protein